MSKIARFTVPPLPATFLIALVVIMVSGCRQRGDTPVPERSALEMDLLKRFGEPDQVWAGLPDERRAEPTMYATVEVPGSHWKMYDYRFNGWVVQVTAKDGGVIRVTAYNIAESQQRARNDVNGLRKRVEGPP